jgi:hypothetical protein
MKALELQKQFLIAESELNRAQLVEDVATLTTGVRAFAGRAKSVGSIVSSVTTLALGLTGCGRSKPAKPATKVSWLHTLLKAAGLISTLWTAFERPGDDREGSKSGK